MRLYECVLDLCLIFFTCLVMCGYKIRSCPADGSASFDFTNHYCCLSIGF